MTAEGFTAHFPTEGRYAEFKEGLSDKQVRRAVVAFSNTDGGVVILGVTDEGVVKGMSLSSKRNAHLHHVLSEIHNPGRYEVFEVTVASKQVVIISVARRVEGFAQLRDGSVLGRFGASNRALIGDELSRLVNRRSLGRFETTPTEAAIGRADPDLLDRMTAAWRWSTEHRMERMQEHGLVSTDGPGVHLTVAGALHLLRNPHEVLGKAHIEIFRYRGDARDYDRRFEASGPRANRAPIYNIDKQRC